MRGSHQDNGSRALLLSVPLQALACRAGTLEWPGMGTTSSQSGSRSSQVFLFGLVWQSQ